MTLLRKPPSELARVSWLDFVSSPILHPPPSILLSSLVTACDLLQDTHESATPNIPVALACFPRGSLPRPLHRTMVPPSSVLPVSLLSLSAVQP